MLPLGISQSTTAMQRIRSVTSPGCTSVPGHKQTGTFPPEPLVQPTASLCNLPDDLLRHYRLFGKRYKSCWQLRQLLQKQFLGHPIEVAWVWCRAKSPSAVYDSIDGSFGCPVAKVGGFSEYRCKRLHSCANELLDAHLLLPFPVDRRREFRPAAPPPDSMTSSNTMPAFQSGLVLHRARARQRRAPPNGPRSRLF